MSLVGYILLMAKFKDRIKELRIEKELSQEELAKAIDVHVKTISKWERGVWSPNIDSIELLANFFKVTAGYIIGMES